MSKQLIWLMDYLKVGNTKLLKKVANLSLNYSDDRQTISEALNIIKNSKSNHEQYLEFEDCKEQTIELDKERIKSLLTNEDSAGQKNMLDETVAIPKNKNN
jgi:hypothetical protein